MENHCIQFKMTFLLYPEKTEKETNYKANNFQNSGNYNHLYVKI